MISRPHLVCNVHLHKNYYFSTLGFIYDRLSFSLLENNDNNFVGCFFFVLDVLIKIMWWNLITFEIRLNFGLDWYWQKNATKKKIILDYGSKVISESITCGLDYIIMIWRWLFPLIPLSHITCILICLLDMCSFLSHIFIRNFTYSMFHNRKLSHLIHFHNRSAPHTTPSKTPSKIKSLVNNVDNIPSHASKKKTNREHLDVPVLLSCHLLDEYFKFVKESQCVEIWADDGAISGR